jgi:hypothetical protein
VALIPVPQIPLSQRALSLLDDTVTRLIRDLDLVDSSAGLTHAFLGDDVVVEADTVHLGYNEVSMGEFSGLRAGRSGQVSLWYSLPRDRMGSVLDETASSTTSRRHSWLERSSSSRPSSSRATSSTCIPGTSNRASARAHQRAPGPHVQSDTSGPSS